MLCLVCFNTIICYSSEKSKSIDGKLQKNTQKALVMKKKKRVYSVFSLFIPFHLRILRYIEFCRSVFFLCTAAQHIQLTTYHIHRRHFNLLNGHYIFSAFIILLLLGCEYNSPRNSHLRHSERNELEWDTVRKKIAREKETEWHKKNSEEEGDIWQKEAKKSLSNSSKWYGSTWYGLFARLSSLDKYNSCWSFSRITNTRNRIFHKPNNAPVWHWNYSPFAIPIGNLNSESGGTLFFLVCDERMRFFSNSGMDKQFKSE